MNIILALETTEKYGSVALLDGRNLLGEICLPQDRRSAQTLTPAMDAMLRNHSVEPKDVKLVAVVTGPGSFTGLRVGVTAAKMFAWAVGAKVEGVCTFTVVVQAHINQLRSMGNEAEAPEYLSIGVDAQRGEVIAALYSRMPDGMYAPLDEDTLGRLMPVAEWWKQAELPGGTLFSGPALERYAAKAPPDAILAEESLWFPQASVLGQIAVACMENDLLTYDCFSILPIYSRLSAAEERRSAIGR